MNIRPGHKNRTSNSNTGAFHFQPCEAQEWSGNESPPLLFTSKPPGREGGVTLFFRTRRTLRRRLGVHDLGELDGVLKESIVNDDEQMQNALGRATNWCYLFPDPKAQPAEELAPEGQFHKVLTRALS